MAQLDAPFLYELDKQPTYFRMILSSVLGGSTYAVQRSLTNDFASYTTIYTGPADTPFNDNTITDGNMYYYRAYALAFGGNTDSDFSPTITADYTNTTQLNPPVFTLGEVYRFSCTLLIYPVINAATYLIQRDTVNTFDNDPVAIPYTPAEIYDGPLESGETYYYRAKSLAGSGDFTDSNWSNTVVVTTLPYTQLDAPLLSTDDITDNSVELTITGVTGGENYIIQRSTNPLFDAFSNVYYGPAGVYVDQPLISETTYYYRAYAAATSADDQSDYSNVEEITTLEPIIPDPSDDPIPGLKYYMGFKDVNGVNIDVRMYFNGYEGAVIPVTGGSEPIQISYTGFDKDMYENGKGIVDAKYTINLLNPGFSDSFYEDITGAEDGEVWVRTERETDNTIFSGWLISDEFKRSFDRTLYEVSLTVVSPFSLMKSKELLEADGRMMFGTKSLYDIVTACISASIHPSLYPSYNIYSSMRETDYAGIFDLFSQLRVTVEAFNDDNGRPPKCYDVIEKICNSFGFIIYWVNDVLFFVHVYDDLQPVKNLKIKDVNDTTGFLIGNSEIITKVRNSKEVSLKYEYGRQVGLLPNGRFLQFNTGTGLFENWQYAPMMQGGSVFRQYNASNVLRLGNGRKVNPYRARFTGSGFSGVWAKQEQWTQGVYASIIPKKGDKINIKIDFRYFDWKAKYGVSHITDFRIPYFYIHIARWPTAGATVDKYQSFFDYKMIEGVSPDDILGNVYREATPGTWLNPSGDALGAATSIIIAVDSTNEIQTYEAEIREPGGSGWGRDSDYLTIFLFGIDWTRGEPVAISNPDKYIDVISVIVSRETLSEGYNSTGEEIYLTQVKQGKIDEPKDVFLGNFNNGDISGALLKGDNTVSRGVARGGTGDSLQNWLVRMMMAQKRGPRYRADFEFKSSVVRPIDLLTLTGSDGSLLPNKYAIGSMDYNMKSAETKVTVIEVNTQDRDYKLGGDETDPEGDYIDEPNGDFDMLENYKTY